MVLIYKEFSSSDQILIHKNILSLLTLSFLDFTNWNCLMKMCTFYTLVNLLVMLLSIFSYENHFSWYALFVSLKPGKLQLCIYL